MTAVQGQAGTLITAKEILAEGCENGLTRQRQKNVRWVAAM